MKTRSFYLYSFVIGLALAAVVGGALWNLKRATRGHDALNVPPPERLAALLQPALDDYFHVPPRGMTQVKWTLLSDRPMQSGISLPKFYVWVETMAGARPLSGVVTVTVPDRDHVEVAAFKSAPQILAHPWRSRKEFPGAVRSEILSRARQAPVPPTVPAPKTAGS